MKKIFCSLLLWTLGIFWFLFSFSDAGYNDSVFWDDKAVITKEEWKVLTANQLKNVDTESYIRNGTDALLRDDNRQIEGVVNSTTEGSDKINDHKRARELTIKKVSDIINYSLGLLGVVSLIYLLYHGFLIMITGDMEKGMKGIKNAAITLFGIWMSWLIISLILRLIENLTE